ncbi:amino acid adenylation protein, partial [Xanthomonas cannabis pv. cannabis]
MTEPGSNKSDDAQRVLNGDDVDVWLKQHFLLDAMSPLSQNQKGIWSRQMMYPADPLYNVAVACVVGNGFERHAFRRACQRFVNNHQLLNAGIVAHGRELVQCIDSGRDLAWREFDSDDTLEACVARAKIDADAPFSLDDGPLYRIHVYATASGQSVVLLVVHHIVCDGSSLSQWLSTIWQDYRAMRQQRALSAPPAAASFFDFVKFEAEHLSSAAGQKSLAYWHSQCADGLPPLDPKLDVPLAADDASVFATDRLSFAIDAELAARVHGFRETGSFNAATLLMGAFLLALSAWRDTQRFTIGLPTLGRPASEFASTVGNFANLVPVVCDLDPTQQFLRWLDDCQRYVYRALDHWYPFAGLVNALPRHSDPHQAIQAVFTYQKFGDAIDIGTLPHRIGDTIDLTFAHDIYQRDEYPLTCEVVEQGDTWAVNLKYKTAMIGRDDVLSLQHALLGVLDDALADPGQPVGVLTARNTHRDDGPMADAELVSNGEAVSDAGAAPDAGAPGAAQPSPDAMSLPARFAAQRRRDPARHALTFNGRHVTYGDLDRESDALARHLLALGVKPGDLVLLCATPSPELIGAILAILKAGAAYVPVDPASPRQRIDHIRADTGARYAITTSACEASVEGVAHRVVLDRDGRSIAASAARASAHALPEVRREDLAYVIYTSGTTGKPKGVMIEHGNVLRLFDRTAHWFDFGRDDVWALFHSVAFDFSVWEIWGALLYGGRLVVLDAEQRKDTELLLDVLADEKVTVFNQTPAAFYSVVRAATGGTDRRTLSLRYVVFGGEKLDFAQLAPWVERYGEHRPALINMYGITETTVHVTYAPVTAAGVKGAHASVIGRPIPDLDLHLLDENRVPVPAGEIGEIYVGGAGVARGYLNRPELTRQRFVEYAGARFYKTGDLARYNAQGELEYIGRNDAQVKIRGFRIELGEIEACVNQHPAVENCVVVAHEHTNGVKHLVAYYCAKTSAMSGSVEARAFREFVGASLPDYMVPAFFVELAQLPVTGNGKFDRQELSLRSIELAPGEHAAAAASATQQRVRALWQQVLSVAPAHLDQGFFEAGGDSLSVVFFARAIEQTFDCVFSPANLFRYATVRDIANYLDNLKPVAVESDAVPGDTPLIAGVDNEMSSPVVPAYYGDSLAIIGISCEVPGAVDHHAFWANLLAGRESSERLSRAALDDAGVGPELADHPDYVPIRFTIPDKTTFDADFFKLSAKLAEFADPQSRQLLMHAWKAVEDAGYAPAGLDDTGVFVATGNSGYQTLLDNADDIEHNDRYLAYVLSQAGSSAALISYHLGLTGPSMHIGTNCSSSLVAIDAAFKSLRAGECRQAIVGASTLFPHPNSGFLYQPGLNFSSSGHCRTFDADADGMMAGEGVAVIVLKNALRAIEDGDAIYAILRSVAVNNDGRQKSGFYAPSVEGQGRVIRTALERAAGVDVESIAYVEAHGTGTRLGDPVEVMAINDVYRQRTDAMQFCAIGSVKPNIGHLDTAAGLAGCIKVALALHARTIPPTINVATPNPAIDWQASCFRLPREASRWPETSHPPRAALSSFGLGGTNAHAILEACPDAWTAPRRAAGPERGPQLLVLSADDPRLLPTMADTLAGYLAAHPDLPLDSVACTLQLGRQAMRHRLAIVAADLSEACALLQHYARGTEASPLPAAIAISRPDNTAPAAGDAADTVAAGLARRDLAALAELWVQGHAIDWQPLYSGVRVRRTHLPTYPFARRHYAVAAGPALRTGGAIWAGSAATSAPRIALQLDEDGSRKVQFRLRRDDFYLADHRVDERAVLPAVMTFELLRAAAMTDGTIPGEPLLRIERVVWMRPVVCDGDEVLLSVELAARGGAQDRRAPVAFALTGADPATGESFVFAEGELSLDTGDGRHATDAGAGEDVVASAALPQPLSSNWIDGAAFYRRIAAGRVHYGAAYLGLVEAHWNQDGLTARVRLPESLSGSLAAFPLHPSLLDGALQASAMLDMIRQHGGDPASWPAAALAGQKLPFFVQQCDVLAPLEPEVVVRVRDHQSAPAAGEARHDIFIYGASGTLLLAIRGFVTRALRTAPGERRTGSGLEVEADASGVTRADDVDEVGSDLSALTIGWTALGADRQSGASPAPVVLFSIGEKPPAALDAHFAGRLARYVPLHAAPDNSLLAALPADAQMVFAFPAVQTPADDPALIDAQRDGVIAAFRWIREMVGHGFEHTDLDCTFVVEGTQQVRDDDTVAPAHASVIGFAQSLAGEYAHWRVRALDVRAFAELPEPAHWPRADGQVVFAWRDGRWFARGLVEICTPAPRPTLYRQGGHYLVLGGAGGIGRTWTEAMIRDYRAQVIWLGRKPRNREIDDEIARLGTLGPAPIYLQADATDLASLRRARHALAGLGIDTLHGVVHSALVLDDRGIASMSESQFVRALDGKVATSVNLTHTFGDCDLDFMLFFSGTISFVKARGQSNYAAGCSFQDAYAMAIGQQWRCAVKLVHWGYWGSVGIVATPEYRRRMRAAGVGSVEPNLAMQRLAQFMQDNHMQQLAFEQRLSAPGAPSARLPVMAAAEASLPPATEPDAAVDYRQHRLHNAASPLLRHLDALQEHNGLRDPVVERAALLKVRQALGEIDALPIGRAHDGAYRAGPRSRLVEAYERWYQESCRQLQRYGLLDVSGVGLPDADEAPDAAWAQVRDRYCAHPSVRAGIELMDACLRNLPAILRGETAATAVMFPDGSMQLVENVHRNHPIADYFNEGVAETVTDYVSYRVGRDRGVRLRILEIGAGTGGTSSKVLPKLLSWREQIDEYRYTDLSKSFLFYAQDTYGPDAPFLKTSILDIEAPLTAEHAHADKRGSYDVVIAANVLHATRNIDRTLRNAHAFLRDGGLLVLNEMSENCAFSHLTFGLLEGWWLYDDESARMPGCPGLFPGEWARQLERIGFADVHFPLDGALSLGQQVIVAQRACDRQPTPSAPEDAYAARDSRSDQSRRDQSKHDKAGIVAVLVASVAEVLRISAGDIDRERSFSDIGLDSILAIQLTNRLNTRFGIRLATIELFDHNTVARLAAHLVDRYGVTGEVSGTAVADAAIEATSSAGAGFAGVMAVVLEQVANAVRVGAHEIDPHRSFADQGVDSIIGVQLVNRLNKLFGLRIATTAIFDHNTVHRLAGFLHERHGATPLAKTTEAAAPALPASQAAPAPGRRDAAPERQAIRALLVERLAAVLRIAPDEVDAQKSFADQGVDSIIGVQLVNQLNKRLGLRIPTTVIFDHNTVDRLVAHLCDAHGAALESTAAADPASTRSMAGGTTAAAFRGAHDRAVVPAPTPDSAPVAMPAAAPGRIRAVSIEGPGDIDDLSIVTLAPRSLARDEVRVAVRAFSLNFSDLLCARGLYPNMPPYPFVPGNEAAGVVMEVGADVTGLRSGDAVVCLSQGCHAEQVVCPMSQVFAKPTSWSFEQACALPIVGITMIDAFRKAAVTHGERVLIQTATGGTGLIAMQLAKHHGAEIFATAGSEQKLRYLRELGVVHAINYRTQDFAQEIQRLAPGGVDVVINTLGGDALQKGLNALAPDGRYIEIAMTALKTARNIDLSSLSDNQTFYSVDLARLGARSPQRIAQYWDELVSLTERGIIAPTISEVVEFREFRDAYRRLADRATIGKIVVRVSEPTPVARSAMRAAGTPARMAGAADDATRGGARALHDDDIAIIGMSGRFARSPDLDAFWTHLASGTSLIAPVTRWDLGDTGQARCDTGSFLDDLSLFDPFFFKISGTEARYMDPQQRLFLEEAWKALEDAGYAGEPGKAQRCGVYVGCSGGDYHLLFPGPGAAGDAGERPPIQSYWGNAVSIIPARISYFLDLHGPAIAIDTACSSSLVALHMACAALRNDEISMALCGGVFVQCTAGFYQQAQRAGMLSATGNCYAFDARADGFVPGEGVGAIVLKRLKDAIADGDHVDGVILASGINQDGSTNGITAPSARSQEELETDVYDRFRIDPRGLQMIEAHGTGTPLGDPIEFAALANAFGRYTQDRGFCALGSVKTNIGHTTTAAGIAGVLKVLLALRHRQLPPSCNFANGNPEIDLENSPFYVNTRLRPWAADAGERRMAAVSSFGFSGTNAHAVIAEAPPVAAAGRRPATDEPVLLVLSAQTREQLDQQLARMAEFASGSDAGELSLADVGFTLAVGRRQMRHRWACVATRMDEFAAYCRAGVPVKPSASAVFYGDANAPAAPGGVVSAAHGANGDLMARARQYVAGDRLDPASWSGLGHRRVRLPVYPFARESYWVQTPTSAPTEARNPWPPLAATGGERGHAYSFSRRLDGQEPFLRDHRVHGEPWLPAVVYWEMTRWSVLQATDAAGQVVVRDLVLQQPLSLGAGPRTVFVHLDRDGAQASAPRFRFTIESRLADTTGDAAVYLTHCSGTVEIAHTDDADARCFLDPSAFRHQAEEIDVAACYRTLAELGIEFGPSHRGLKKLFRCRGQLLAQVGRSGAAGVDAGYLLSPTILDGALQANIGNLIDSAADTLPLPYAMDSLTIVDAPQDPSWVWIYPSRDGARTATGASHDIEVFDDSGRLLLVMRGCRSAQAKRQRALHPLVHAAPNAHERHYVSAFDGREFFLDGHRIAGVKVLPAACYLEMARYVNQCAGFDAGVLRDVIWLAPYQASGLQDGARPASVATHLDAGAERRCRIGSRRASGDEVLHFVARCDAASESTPDRVDVDAVVRRTSGRLDRDAMAALVETASSFGEAFQVMTWLQHGEDEAIAAYRLPAGHSEPFHWHPGILSAAFGAVEMWIAARGEAGAHRLPYGIDSVFDYARPADSGYILVRRVSGEGAKLERYDVDLLDERGHVATAMRGYSVRPWVPGERRETTDTATRASAVPVTTATLGWRDAPVPALTSVQATTDVDRLFFVPEHDVALQTLLRDLDPAARLCGLGCADATADAEPDDDAVARLERAYRQAFEMLRDFAGASGTRAAHVLMLVPDSGHDDVMPTLQALCATAALEYGRLAAKTVFYAVSGVADPAADVYRLRLQHELLRLDPDAPEVRVALDGGRHARRVDVGVLPERATLAGQRRDGSLGVRPLERGDVVWLVGGMGGIGLHVARDLAARGMRVTISGRRAEPSGWDALARAAGATIDYVAVDVADQSDVERAVARIVAQHGRLDAVIHSAGVINDAYLRHSDAAAAEPVFAPKLRGSVNLDHATRALDLKCFAMFSSLSALGSPGQAAYAVANAFVNRLAVRRNRDVLAGTRRGRSFAIGWPLWLDGGMEMPPERRAMMRELTGLEGLSAVQGLDVLDAVLNACPIGMPDDGVLLVAPGADRERIVRMLDSRFVVADAAGDAVAGSVADAVAAEPVRLRAAVLDALKTIIAAQQTIPVAKIDDGALFFDLGYDSISLIGLARDLGERLGLSLQPTLFFEYPALWAFADHLVEAYRERLAAQFNSVPMRADASPDAGEAVAGVTQESDGAARANHVVRHGHAVHDAGASQRERAGDNGCKASPGAAPAPTLLDALIAVVAAHCPDAPQAVTADSAFYRLGLDSMDFIQLADTLSAALSIQIQPTLFYECPDLRALGEHLARTCPDLSCDALASLASDLARSAAVEAVAPPVAEERIAVIGMSCRFPGSDNPDEFWRNLSQNRDLIGRMSGLRAALSARDTIDGDRTPPLEGGFVDDIERFDPQFFGLTPMEAEFMDPQSRQFVQCAWRAVEDAGYRIGDLAKRRVGVFVGVTTSDYRDLWLSRIGAESATHLGLAHFMIANRVSYLFDLRGPSEVIDTACSSSLVAIHRACESLASGNCEIAIVGGVNVIANPAVTEAASAAGMLSPDGRCKTFDSAADGFGRGEGVGVVVLKRVSDAIAHGDHVDAVIAASGENHGGRSSSPSAPNPDAQRQLIVDLYRRAGIDPASVGYIEAHGTGTSLGDPIEVKALVRAFAELAEGRAAASAHCALGSVKANIGHLEAAAGISGFIKTVLMLKHARIPGNPHLKQPNPYLELDGSPFHLVRETHDWPAPQRRAGVSSFGMGGSNAHVVVDAAEAYVITQGATPETAQRPLAIGLSARRPAELDEIVGNLLTFLSSRPAGELALRDLAFTLARGREALPHRLAFVACDLDDLQRKLTRARSGGDAHELARQGIAIGRAGDAARKADAQPLDDALAAAYRGTALAPDSLREVSAWAHGDLDVWSDTLAGDGRRVSLPTYPFGGKAYWLPNPEPASRGPSAPTAAIPASPTSVGDATSAHALHPLLHRDEPVDARTRRFVSSFSGNEFFLADHRVQGLRLLPGVASLEMALTAACIAAGETGDTGAVLRNVVWSRPVVWEPARATVALELLSGADVGSWRYRLNDGGGDACAEGEIALTASMPAGKLDLDRMRHERDASLISAEECYHRYREVGIEYGPGHRALERLFVGRDDVLAELALPAAFVDSASHYRLHPGLLDAAWQAVIGLAPDRGQREARLPFALDAMRILRQPRASRLWAWIRPSRDGDASVDMDIALPDGSVLIMLRGLHTRSQAAAPVRESRADASQDRAAGPDGDMLPVGEVTLSPIWEPLLAPDAVSPPERDALWVFGANDEVRRVLGSARNVAFFDGLDGTEDAFRRALQAHVADAKGVAPHVLWIAGGGTDDGLDPDVLIARQAHGILPLFRSIKALIGAGLDVAPLALTVVTRNVHALAADGRHDVSDAGIVGFAGAVAHEYPHWTVRHWDIDAPADPGGRFFGALDAHLAATAGSDGDVRVHRDGRWYRQRLVRVVDEGTAEPSYRQGGVYLVIGGAGGLGRTWSRRMIERFGARVVWIGRRPLDGEIRTHLDAFGAPGRGGVTYLQADAGNPFELERAYAEIVARFGAIHGVVHAPIVLADRSLAHMDEATFALGYDTKLKTCVNLYPLFSREPLDFMLFFSSLNAFSRSAGQSNYVAGCTFTDAYAKKLDTLLSCDVKVVNWGYWGDVGIVSGERHRVRAGAAGLDSIGADDGLRAVDALLARPGTQIAYVKTARPISARHYDASTVMRRYARTIPDVAAQLIAPRAVAAPADVTALSRETLAFRRRAGALVERLLLATLQQAALAPESTTSARAAAFGDRLRAYAPQHVEVYEKWLRQSHRLLVEAGHLTDAGGELSCRVSAVAISTLWTDWRRLAADYVSAPGYVAQIDLLEYCLRALGDILLGRVAATDVMFPDGGMARVEGIYRNNAVSDHFNTVQSEVIAAYVEARVRMQPDVKLRLLEIGAGTGGTTAGLLRRLEPWHEHIAEYCYTDVSKAFLIHG